MAERCRSAQAHVHQKFIQVAEIGIFTDLLESVSCTEHTANREITVPDITFDIQHSIFLSLRSHHCLSS